MVGKHVNILKKQSCENSNMTNPAYQTRQRIVSNIRWLLQKTDGLFGSFHFPVLKMSAFPKISTRQNQKEYYNKTIVLIRP